MSATKEVRTGGRKCPGCMSAHVRRSQMRGFLEHGVLRTVGVRAYRCESCDKRYYGFEGIEGKREKLRIEGERNR
jgi:transcriptional regulator NrdR family protein